MMVDDRYNRQELISGWKQEKLNSTRAVVIGSGNLANYALVSLAALGIGNLEVYDTAKVASKRAGEDADREFLLFKAREGEPKAKALEAMLRQINPSSRINGISVPLSAPLLAMIGSPDFIIETTNLPESKGNILKYASSRKIRVISASASRESAEAYFVNPWENSHSATLPDYKNQPQGVTLSGIMGGIITEEVRKAVMQLTESDVPAKRTGYSLSSPRRFAYDVSDNKPDSPRKQLKDKLEDKLKEKLKEELKRKKILVVGAGALGNFAVLGAALEGVGNIDILDFDEIESTNLNRQILFYDAVGKMKATALAEKVAEIVPAASVQGLVEKLDENSTYFTKNKPDAILDCVDSFAARAIINYFAVRNEIPLISGGTDPRSGQVVVYQPKKSACLDCKLAVEKALAEQRKAASCRYAPDPSVIMTNQIVGNMMVGEMMKVLSAAGEPVRRILKYDATIPARGGLVGSDEICSCSKPEIKEWLKLVDKKAEKPAEKA